MRGHTDTLQPYQSTWRSGQTKTIRVPVAIADQVLNIARLIDQGELPELRSQIIQGVRPRDRALVRRALDSLLTRFEVFPDESSLACGFSPLAAGSCKSGSELNFSQRPEKPQPER